jgi:NADH-quinone oxidoreductase subunit G
MVEIEGNPRLQIACNTVITEGMKINNTSEKVKEAVRWGLDFHLINHPLDCPICDQAGECGLQDQYMEFGKYDPEMAEKKVKKHKVVDLGPTVVLDSERCILCSRCVRFTDEVSKTFELGIFNRGDRSEIGTHAGKPLNNKYSYNTVDICPVGALTSKDFRFRQRVWFLKDQPTICNGCSTGCNIKIYFNKEGFYRVKPRFNEQVNGHWMCDEGRDIYKFCNREVRWTQGLWISAQGQKQSLQPGALAKKVGEELAKVSGRVAVVVTGQYTVEEYQSFFASLKKKFPDFQLFHWINNKDKFDEFDNLLLRGDRNPNTRGLLQEAGKVKEFSPWLELEQGLAANQFAAVIVAGPENQVWFPEMSAVIQLVAKAPKLVWMQTGKNSELENLKTEAYLIPMKSFVEKDGTFINHKGLEQKFKKVTTVVGEALTLAEAGQLLSGENLMIKPSADVLVEASRPTDVVMLETRKKNEFIYHRGPL